MLLPDTARKMLVGKAFAHVVTRGTSGGPQVSMVWADEMGGELAFNSSSSVVKLRNIERDPVVVASVQDPDNPQQYLVVYGRAEVLPEGGREHIDRLAARFLGMDRYPYLQPGEERVSVIVHAERIRGVGPWAEMQRP